MRLCLSVPTLPPVWTLGPPLPRFPISPRSRPPVLLVPFVAGGFASSSPQPLPGHLVNRGDTPLPRAVEGRPPHGAQRSAKVPCPPGDSNSSIFTHLRKSLNTRLAPSVLVGNIQRRAGVFKPTVESHRDCCPFSVQRPGPKAEPFRGGVLTSLPRERLQSEHLGEAHFSAPGCGGRCAREGRGVTGAAFRGDTCKGGPGTSSPMASVAIRAKYIVRKKERGLFMLEDT